MQGTMGVITMFGGTYAPLHTALCYGALIQISENQALYSLLGTFYGGDGRVTMGLPDLRGRTPVGTGSGPGLTTINLGNMVGAEQMTLTVDHMPQHTHTATFIPTGGTEPTATMKTYNGGSSSDEPDGLYLGKSVGGNLYSNGSGFGVTETSLAADAITIEGGSAAGGTVTVADAGGSAPINIRSPGTGLNYIIFTQGDYPSRN